MKGAGADSPRLAARLTDPKPPNDAPSAPPTHAAKPAAKLLRVIINLDLLRQNLSKEHGRDWTHDEVIAWLADARFQRNGRGWIVREPDLGQLDPTEVTDAEDY